ncbi:MAG: aspartate aminotransferase family protein [Nitrospinae bacterium]|nr:aspartate aminotransferase family protein [Nitrospinota bacterium]
MTDRHIFKTYNRYPVTFVRGEGVYLWDETGKRYIDFVAGLAVNNVGHCHKDVVKAISDQASKLIHVSNLYYTQPQSELARLMTASSFADRVFFCNSGAEANEAAIKLARRYSRERFGGAKRYEIITMLNSFHGRTMATITATGQKKMQEGFQPLLAGFKHIPFNDLEALKKSFSEKTCAVMIEPIQGEGGVNIPDAGYLEAVGELCREKRVLLIFDEVQTGMGRTGRLFAHEHYNVKPDIMTLAKGLAGGMPIGAMLAREDIASFLPPGSHASTFGGNPVSAAAGIATFKLMSRSLLSNCKSVGKYMIKRLNTLKKRYKFIKDVRGAGLMVAMELDFPGREITMMMLEKGILINCTAERVLRFVPPLMVGKKEVDIVVDALEDIFSSGEL